MEAELCVTVPSAFAVVYYKFLTLFALVGLRHPSSISVCECVAVRPRITIDQVVVFLGILLGLVRSREVPNYRELQDAHVRNGRRTRPDNFFLNTTLDGLETHLDPSVTKLQNLFVAVGLVRSDEIVTELPEGTSRVFLCAGTHRARAKYQNHEWEG
jgi:hypothetical protein